MLLAQNEQREGRQTPTKADETVSIIALFHCSAETCSVEGPNQEYLQKV